MINMVQIHAAYFLQEGCAIGYTGVNVFRKESYMINFTKKYPYITCVLIDIALIIIQLVANKCKRIIIKERNK